jgi:hypothetical protein
MTIRSVVIEWGLCRSARTRTPGSEVARQFGGLIIQHCRGALSRSIPEELHRLLPPQPHTWRSRKTTRSTGRSRWRTLDRSSPFGKLVSCTTGTSGEPLEQATCAPLLLPVVHKLRVPVLTKSAHSLYATSPSPRLRNQRRGAFQPKVSFPIHSSSTIPGCDLISKNDRLFNPR